MAAPAVAIPARVSERLGDLLVREGLINRENLAKALQEQASNPGQRLGLTVVKMGLVPETEVVRMLARQYRMPAVDLSRFEVDTRLLKLIPAELASTSWSWFSSSSTSSSSETMSWSSDAICTSLDS